ncbi:ABC transporter permease [Nocardioides rubriscoriae]|uniref:ABC transporter permease n=1 Tax=Nocardioides rubriscoriae TaxID=642762 RepID=UPI0011E026E9|nr:ABC transporter permease subunit [Nocardioides rubriscoriae]
MTLLAGSAVVADLAAREPKCYSKDVNDWFCLDYVRDRSDEIQQATTTHLQITVTAVLLGLALAFPLALLARRLPRLEALVLGLSTFVYTIPSLALLPLLVPLTGLTKTTVVIGLGLYCLTILVRAMLDGLRSVPDEVRESATGMGFGRTRLLLRVELPLALPVLMAGLRVATVSTVALTTIGTVVSEGGLGKLIADGKSTEFNAELMTGAVLCVLLALVLDVVLVLAQRGLTPWTRRVRTA